MADKAIATARELYRQHQAREKFNILPEDVCPQNLTEAYEAQRALEQLYQEAANGRDIGGAKVALTSPAMQEFFNVNQPAGASIFCDVIHDSPVTLHPQDYVNLSVESEIAFRLKADLADTGRPYDRDSVVDAISGCMAATEIIDDRGADYSKSGPGAPLYCCVADLAWNRGCVLGNEADNWQSLDIANLQAVMEINGKIVGKGHGRDALGHPLISLAWVANHQISRGRPLLAGDIIMTGSVVPTHRLNSGDVMRTIFESLGDARITVT